MKVAEWIWRYTAFWESRLDALKRYLALASAAPRAIPSKSRKPRRKGQ